MDDEAFIEEFCAESLDGLAEVERHLLQLESADGIDAGTVDEIFRAVHSIKGGAGFLGLDQLVTLAHHAETLMDHVRKGSVVLSPIVADQLLAGIDGLRALLHKENIAIDGLCAGLDACWRSVQVPSESGREAVCAPADEHVVSGSDGYDLQITVPTAQMRDHPDCNDGILSGIAKIGQIAHHKIYIQDGKEFFCAHIRTPLSIEIVQSLYGLDSKQVSLLESIEQDASGRDADCERPTVAGDGEAVQAGAPSHVGVPVSPQSTNQRSPAPGEHRNAEPPPSSSAKVSESSIRVNARFLDDLLEATGNMVMARNQMLSRYNFQDDISFAVLSRCITEMHKAVVQQRMQSIGSLFERFRRPVRDLANKLGKDVEFQTDGGDIELDRTIIEAFADPLNHMVRNAVDHAIEPPDTRVSNGKSRVGRIILRAYHQSGEVIVEIEDDGRGIDHEGILGKALEKGVVTPDQARVMKPRDVLHLIFAPGFSTKAEASDISGRGVGMDVVKTNVERIGGAIEIHTNPGAGSLFAFRLPLTQTVVSSSLISAIVIEVAGQRFVLPQTAVNEIIQVDPQDEVDHIKQLDGQDVYQLRDKVLAIVHLEDCLSLERTFRHPRTGEIHLDRRSRIADRRQSESREVSRRYASQRSGSDRRWRRQTLIVLEFRRALFGIMVDSVIGVEEVVVRSTPKLFQSVPGFCGHTVLGDGSVVMMLDVAGIVEQRGLRLQDLPEYHVESRSALKTAQQMITFENAPREFFAIPLMMITLIEHIKASDIHRIGSKEYYQLKGSTVPLIRLEDHLDVGSHADAETYHLILPARVPKPIGILAGGQLRITDFSESFDGSNDNASGVVGTAFYNGHVITLLDLYALVERVMPEAFAGKQAVDGVAHVLLAEDNKFFSKLVSGYLNIPGIDLHIVEDGQAAWDMLQQRRDFFDLVVSDIEMPRMNGFELVQRIKSDPAHRHLPVLALTSLADEDSRRRGMKAGFDEYAVKIDKQDLLSMIHRFIERGRAQGVVSDGT